MKKKKKPPGWVSFVDTFVATDTQLDILQKQKQIDGFYEKLGISAYISFFVVSNPDSNGVLTHLHLYPANSEMLQVLIEHLQKYVDYHKEHFRENGEGNEQGG